MQNKLPYKKSILDGDSIYLVLLLIFSLFICWPLFKEDFITTIDGGDHLLRLYSMDQFIGRGQWFVRWIPYLHGYGYPEFNFYPPLVAMVGTVLKKTGLSIIWALNLTCFLFILLSAYTMYFFAREFWGSQGAFLSAAAYIFAPYQMVDLYARGDYAESASFAFLPLILWAFLKLHKELNVFYLSIASFSVAGLFLTNNCITLIFCPIIFFYILVLHFSKPHSHPYFSTLISLAVFGLGIGLAAFFWLPALIEKNFVHIDRMLNGTLDFHNNFLSIRQLIYSPWPKKPGTRLPYEIGPMHCLLAVTFFCFIQKIIKDRKYLTQQLLFLFFILITAIFLTLPPSLMIWEHIHILRFIQFPSRLLVVMVLIVSIFIGGLPLISPKHRLTIMAFVVLAIFLMNFSYCHPPYGTKKVDLKNVPSAFIFHNLQPQDGGEFIPIWVNLIRYPTPVEDLEIIKGYSQILSRREVPEVHQTFTVEAMTPSLLCFNVFYFPGWTIKVDGHLVEILKDNPFGLIIFPINEGFHEIKADFGPTPLRQAATAVSLISLLILIGILFYGFIST